jgi:hypothetical protein
VTQVAPDSTPAFIEDSSVLDGFSTVKAFVQRRITRCRLSANGDGSRAMAGAKEVVPGQSATCTVTVTPLCGFTGTVSLTVGSQSGFPTGITSGGFSPTSIVGVGSSTLTMNTTASASPYALSLTITGTSGTISHASATTLLVNIPPPLALTAAAGNAQVSLSWPASLGASGYTVQRALVSGGPYVTIGCPTTTSYTDTRLTNGTTYYYVVAGAYTGDPDAGGGSASSPEASATPMTTTTRVVATTTTTLPCTTPRCLFDAAVHGPACAGATVPQAVTAKIEAAVGLFDRAGTSTGKKWRRLLGRERKTLAMIGCAAAHASKGRKPRLSAACATAIAGAASAARGELGP